MEEIFVLILMTFGTVFGGIIMWKFFDIVRNSINKNKGKYDDERFDRLAKAFIQHRKKTEKRLENIEAIITGQQSGSSQKQVDQPYETLTMNSSENHSESMQQHSKNKGKQRVD